MKFAFRVDASVEIGAGHVMRCLSLADHLVRRGHSALFICRAHQGHLGGMIEDRGHRLRLLRAPSNQKSQPPEDAASPPYSHWLGDETAQDALQTLQCIGEEGCAAVVVDHYGIDQEWEIEIRKSISLLFVIDDLANRRHHCDLLLDQNLGRMCGDYRELVPPDCELLIGPTYALLRDDFSKLRESAIKARLFASGRACNVLVTMGAVDADNWTVRVLDALDVAGLPAGSRVEVVLGSTAPWLAEVREHASSMQTPCSVVVNCSDMAVRMASADFSVGAAGSTAWERCCLGVPSVMVLLAENQRVVAESLGAVGAALVVDGLTSTSPDLLTPIRAIASDFEMRRRMSAVAQTVTTGVGAARVCERILARLSEEAI